LRGGGWTSRLIRQRPGRGRRTASRTPDRGMETICPVFDRDLRCVFAKEQSVAAPRPGRRAGLWPFDPGWTVRRRLDVPLLLKPAVMATNLASRLPWGATLADVACKVGGGGAATPPTFRGEGTGGRGVTCKVSRCRPAPGRPLRQLGAAFPNSSMRPAMIFVGATAGNGRHPKGPRFLVGWSSRAPETNSGGRGCSQFPSFRVFPFALCLLFSASCPLPSSLLSSLPSRSLPAQNHSGLRRLDAAFGVR